MTKKETNKAELTSIEKKKSSQEQQFKDLFKKRKSTIILGGLIFCLIAFGISKSFIFISCLIAISPFVVIFWGTFGEQIMSLLKIKYK